MRGKILWTVVLFAAGFVILCLLGNWQLQRMHWKSGVLSAIEARIGAAAVALPPDPDPVDDEYLPVTAVGVYEGPVVRVQSAIDRQGAGYRILQAFRTEDGRVLVDRGFVPQGAEIPAAPGGEVTIEGNLVWPEETDQFTPAPDPEAHFFYARDLGAISDLLETRPLLIQRRAGPGGGGAMVTLPVGTGQIPNDHAEYAITWFSLAAVWLVMSCFLIYRMRRQGGAQPPAETAGPAGAAPAEGGPLEGDEVEGEKA